MEYNKMTLRMEGAGSMLLFFLLLFFLAIWLGIKLVGLSLKLIYVVFIGIPLAAACGILGILLCCTVLLIPLGKAMFHLASWVACPF